jgi:hypothetical protein
MNFNLNFMVEGQIKDHVIDPLTLDHKVNEISYWMMLSIIRKSSLLKKKFNYK